METVMLPAKSAMKVPEKKHPAMVKMASARHGIGWRNLNDLRGSTQDGICTKFNVEGLPTFVIVSPDGIVLDKMRGYAEDAVTNLVNKNVNLQRK